MPEVLSQAEIDSLLTAVSSGELASDGTSPQASFASEGGKQDWIAYDLTSHEKIVRSRMVALQGIHERFARLFRGSLSQYLKRPVTVNFNRIDFMKFSDYLKNLVLPTSVNILSMNQLKGSLLFLVSSKLTYALVDAYYGGSERPFSKIGTRDEFTSIENNMVNRISKFAVSDIQEAWRLKYPLKLDHVRTETNPHFIGTIHPSELVAVVIVDVEFENLTGPCQLVIQLEPLLKIQEYLGFNVTGEFSMEKTEWRKHWISEVMTTELLVQVELGSTKKTLGEIERFQKGQVLALNQDATGPLVIFVQGLPVMSGMMGNVRGNVAVQMTSTLNSDESHEGERNDKSKMVNG